MEETRTRFCAAMPASRNASSKDVRRSLCLPVPLVRKMRLGTIFKPNVGVLHSQNWRESQKITYASQLLWKISEKNWLNSCKSDAGCLRLLQPYRDVDKRQRSAAECLVLTENQGQIAAQG